MLYADANGTEEPECRSEPQPGENGEQRTSAERQLLAREQLELVWGAVERLPNQQRTVFLLRFVEEMSLDEIATAIGVGIASVKTHLRRATLAVRQAAGLLNVG